jgi:hypothetical protein
MSRAKPPTVPLWLLMSETRECGYFHIDGRIVVQVSRHGSTAPEGPDDHYSAGTLWSGLRLRCQGDEQSRARAGEGQRDTPVYGYSCEYHDVYSVDRRMAIRMAKTLTDLDRKLDKLTDQRGYARTYGEYVGRVAEIFGCAGIAFTRTARSRDTTGERWIWTSVGSGVTRIDQQIAAWVEEARPVEVAS